MGKLNSKKERISIVVLSKEWKQFKHKVETESETKHETPNYSLRIRELMRTYIGDETNA